MTGAAGAGRDLTPQSRRSATRLPFSSAAVRSDGLAPPSTIAKDMGSTRRARRDCSPMSFAQTFTTKHIRLKRYATTRAICYRLIRRKWQFCRPMGVEKLPRGARTVADPSRVMRSN